MKLKNNLRLARILYILMFALTGAGLLLQLVNSTASRVCFVLALVTAAVYCVNAGKNCLCPSCKHVIAIRSPLKDPEKCRECGHVFTDDD